MVLICDSFATPTTVLVVFIPNFPSNHAITYTNIICIVSHDL